MNNLLLYGWGSELSQQKQASVYNDFVHGRVAITHKTCYKVISEQGDFICELTGNMLYGRDPSDYPCTGDWVLFQPIDRDKGIIFEMLPRKKTLYRLQTGSVSAKQAIAAHVDKGFVVQSLDNNFNVRRIERFLLQLADEDIQPAIVLTKTDLAFDKAEVEKSLKHISDKVPVFFTSVQFPESIELLGNYIATGETVVFAGSSGVGKSTLINALCRREIFKTATISDSTGKGKHTSVRREMILMDNAGVLIDTPGIKVFGVTSNDLETLTDVMDIRDFAEKCRFKDCEHVNEKGCAVIKAVQEGLIEEGVYTNFVKLRKEAWHYTASVHEKRKREKSFSKMVKAVKKNK
jgi:ribosome biogenesis GTPase / thiamine phosphate phosphatase